MTVFVVQKPRAFRDRRTGEMRIPDLSPALQYGAIHFVFEEHDNPGLAPGQAIITARKALRGFSDDDYLMSAGGDPVGLLVAGLAAAAENMGRVRFLRWERTAPRVFNDNPHAPPGYYMPCEVRYNVG